MEEEESQDLKDKWQSDLGDLRWGIDKSLLYHRRREHILDMTSSVISIMSIVLGSGVAASILTSLPTIGITSSVMIVLLTTCNLIFKYELKASKHSKLAKKWSSLKAEIVSSDQLTDEMIRDWQVRRLKIEDKEGPALDALNVDCHNVLCESKGLDSHRRRIKIWQIPLLHIISLQRTFPLLDVPVEKKSRLSKKRSRLILAVIAAILLFTYLIIEHEKQINKFLRQYQVHVENL